MSDGQQSNQNQNQTNQTKPDQDRERQIVCDPPARTTKFSSSLPPPPLVLLSFLSLSPSPVPPSPRTPPPDWAQHRFPPLFHLKHRLGTPLGECVSKHPRLCSVAPNQHASRRLRRRCFQGRFGGGGCCCWGWCSGADAGVAVVVLFACARCPCLPALRCYSGGLRGFFTQENGSPACGAGCFFWCQLRQLLKSGQGWSSPRLLLVHPFSVPPHSCQRKQGWHGMGCLKEDRISQGVGSTISPSVPIGFPGFLS